MTMVERPMTAEEIKEIVPLNQKDHTRVFRHKLAEFEQKCTNEHKPFCRRCAYMSYEKAVRMKELDLRERGIEPSGTHPELITLAKEHEIEKFSSKQYFQVKAISKIEEPLIIDLNKVMRHTANWVMLECEKFKHPFSLRIELVNWPEWESKNLTRKEAKEAQK